MAKPISPTTAGKTGVSDDLVATDESEVEISPQAVVYKVASPKRKTLEDEEEVPSAGKSPETPGGDEQPSTPAREEQSGTPVSQDGYEYPVPKGDFSAFENRCRVCQRGPDQMQLVRLCRCPYLVHKPCLEMRLMDTSKDSCQICGDKYELELRPRYSVPRGFLVWVSRYASKATLLLMLGYMLLMAPMGSVYAAAITSCFAGGRDISRVWGTQELWQHQIREPQVPFWLLLVTAMMLVGYLGSVVLMALSIVRSFFQWYSTTFIVIVL